MALQTKRTDSMARKKLVFNNPTLDDKYMKVDSSKKGDSTGMETDETMLVVPGGEVFKRKQEDILLQKRGERKLRHVADDLVQGKANSSAKVVKQPRQGP